MTTKKRLSEQREMDEPGITDAEEIIAALDSARMALFDKCESLRRENESVRRDLEAEKGYNVDLNCRNLALSRAIAKMPEVELGQVKRIRALAFNRAIELVRERSAECTKRPGYWSALDLEILAALEAERDGKK